MKKTPKEKARELVDKYIGTNVRLHINLKLTGFTELKRNVKKNSLIAVDEILEAITFNTYDEESYNQENNYWENVKKEIELL